MTRPIVRELDGQLVVEGRVEGRRAARRLAACAPVCAAAAAAGAILSRDDGLFAVAAVAPLILLLMAGIFALSNRRTRFDLVSRRARGPTLDLPFEDLAAVQVAPHVSTVTPIGTDGTDFSEQRWRVTLLDRRALAARHVYRRVVARMARRPGDPPLTPAQRAAIKLELDPAWDGLTAGSHVVAEHSNPLPALAAGRHLARRLRLSFMDASGVAGERPAELVDAPLAERLRRLPLDLGEGPERPREIDEHAEPDRLTLRWRQSRWVPVLLAAAVAVALIGLGVALKPEFLPVRAALLLAGIALLSRVAKLARGHGVNELIVDGERCLWRSRAPFPHEEALPLSELDSVDVLSHERPCLALFGRDRWLKLPMPEAAAAWARSRLLVFLQRAGE